MKGYDSLNTQVLFRALRQIQKLRNKNETEKLNHSKKKKNKTLNRNQMKT